MPVHGHPVREGLTQGCTIGHLLRAQTERFAEIIGQGDLDATIAFCPGWSLRDLVDHLGGVHQWAANPVVTGDPVSKPEPAEGGRAALVDWYQRQAGHLIDVLASRSADSPAWTLDQGDPTVGFWRRRQVHETAIHTWDARHRVASHRSSSRFLPGMVLKRS